MEGTFTISWKNNRVSRRGDEQTRVTYIYILKAWMRSDRLEGYGKELLEVKVNMWFQIPNLLQERNNVSYKECATGTKRRTAWEIICMKISAGQRSTMNEGILPNSAKRKGLKMQNAGILGWESHLLKSILYQWTLRLRMTQRTNCQKRKGQVKIW